MALDPRTPVLVGIGTSYEDAQAWELMANALESAAADAGSRSLLAGIDRIAVPLGTWSYPDPARLVATRIGAARAKTHFGEIGVSQQTLVSEALRAIAAGSSDIAVVVGGEGRQWARTSPNGEPAQETLQPGAHPDFRLEREPDFVAPPEMSAGLVQPVEQYALIENALGHAEGLDQSAHRDEVSSLWARFNVVAQSNPSAAFPAPLSFDELRNPGDRNRPMAFPYNKWHVSQWTVNQASALLLCSVAAALEHNVARDRWVFPLVGIDASHGVSLSRRRWLHRWPAMGELGKAAAARLKMPLDEIEHVELYSCFPAAVRVQQRELGLTSRDTPTLTGGMAFAGGPFNNFVYQSTATMIPLLRERPDTLGLVSTVCGFLTKPGLAVWTCSPDGSPPLLDDFAQAATNATPTQEVVGDHDGAATVASATVTYQGQEPVRTVIIGDTAGGDRCVAVSPDTAIARDACRSSLVGAKVNVVGQAFSV